MLLSLFEKIIIGITASHFGDFGGRYKVKLVGELPSG
jgi:hypothetical protein